MAADASRQVNSWARSGTRAVHRRHEFGVRSREAWAARRRRLPAGSAQGGRKDQAVLRAAFIQAIRLAIGRFMVSMTKSRLRCASTRRSVSAQPWGVYPHLRRFQRDVGFLPFATPSGALSCAGRCHLICERRFASGLPEFCVAAPFGGSTEHGFVWALKTNGVDPLRLRSIALAAKVLSLHASHRARSRLFASPLTVNRPQLFSPSIVRGRIDHRHR